MKKYYFVLQLCFIIIVFSMVGRNVFPTRIDIEYMEVVEIIGLDSTQEGVRITALLKDINASSSESTDNADSSKYKLVVADSATYSQAANTLRNITDKYISLNHIKYYIVGEPTAKSSLRDIVDYLSRTNDLESSAQILVSDETTAQDFLMKVVESEDDIVSNIDSTGNDLNSKNYTVKVTVLDIMDMFLQDKIQGVIPYISEIKESLQGNFAQEITEGQETKNVFAFKHLGIISEMKVVDKLFFDEIENYNLARGDADDLVILANISDDEKILVNCNKEKYSMLFEVNGNSIEKIKIRTEYIANIEEVHSNTNVFNSEIFNNLQEFCERKTKDNIDTAINKCIESGIDYMNLCDAFERQHPYVYMKIKDNFLEELSKASIEVDARFSINNTYDVIHSNKFQKGGNAK